MGYASSGFPFSRLEASAVLKRSAIILLTILSSEYPQSLDIFMRMLDWFTLTFAQIPTKCVVSLGCAFRHVMEVTGDMSACERH